MHEYTKKKRGYTVAEYIADYNKNPHKFVLKYPTKRQSIRNKNAEKATNRLIQKIRNKDKIKKDILLATAMEIHKQEPMNKITWEVVI